MRTSCLPALPLLLCLAATAPLTGCGGPSEPFGTGDFGETSGTGSFGGDTGGGDVITDPGPGGDPFAGKGREVFLKTVAATLEENCSDCHANAKSGAPVFMAATPESTYVMLALYGGMITGSVNSRLTQQGTHAGPDLPAEERQIVTNWLNLEASERGFFSGSSFWTLAKALNEVGGCMSQDDWTANGLDGLADVQTQDGEACSKCHSTGEHGVFLNADPVKTFEGNRQFPVSNRWVRGVIDLNKGQFISLDGADVFATYGKASCDPAVFTGCHPIYELPPELKQGVKAFSEAVVEKWETEACASK
jgi:hypothetical protein